MVQKKSYSRYFIILQEDEKGYAPSGDKMPSGYVKLETKNDKCKICFYFQNVKKENTPYLLILICNKPECKKIICVGEVNIEQTERNEYIFEYPMVNIAETGISVDNICGAAVIKTIDKDIISILSGFTSSEAPIWKGFELLVKPKVQEKELVNEEKQEQIVEEIKNENVENKFDDYERLIEETKEKHIECDNDEQMERVVPENHETIANNDEQEQKDEISDQYRKSEKDHKNKKHKSEEFYEELIKDMHEEKGICTEINNTKWYKIDSEKLKHANEISDVNKYIVIYYPMMNYYPYITKYGHYLIGYKYGKCGELKYLVYGVPGKRNFYDQPYGGKSGFVTWLPLDSRECGKNAMGYWIMFFDYKNYSVAIP